MGETRVMRDADGVWYARPYLGTDKVTGRAIRPYRRFPEARSEAEAQRMADEWRAGVEGLAASGSSARLADAVERYLESAEAVGAPANTISTYRNLARHLGALGRVPVGELTTPQVDRFYRLLLRDGYAGTTVELMHWFLSGVYHWLVGSGVVASNPVAAARYPRYSRSEPPSFDLDDLPALLALIDDAAASERGPRRVAGIAATFGYFLGVRVGEAAAIRWRDCERRLGVVRVRGTVTMVRGRAERQPFTKRRRPRTLAAPEEFWERLALWRRRQRARGVPVGAGCPVCTDDGSWRRPSLISEAFTALLAGAGYEGSYHKLRHTHATALLADGVNPRVVQERLGHATIATTLSLYAHVMPGMDAEAAAAFADMATAGDWWPGGEGDR